MNRAQEPRSRGGSSVAGALYAPAGLAGEHVWRFSWAACLGLTRIGKAPQTLAGVFRRQSLLKRIAISIRSGRTEPSVRTGQYLPRVRLAEKE